MNLLLYYPNILHLNFSIFTHDLYDDITGVHDIALVKLKRRRGSYINLDTEYVQPICLPSKQQNFDQSNCEVSGWGSWSTNGVQDNGLSLMGQSVNIDKICTSQNQGQICVGNPSATTQKDFTFDDGMPLSCKKGQNTFLRGLHAKKADPCQNGCPLMRFLQTSAYLDWINARLAL